MFARWRLLCQTGGGRFGGNTRSSSLARPLSETGRLKAHDSPASAGPQRLGLARGCSLSVLPRLEEEKTSQVIREVFPAWQGAGLLAVNPSLADRVYITVCINSLPSSSLSRLPYPLLKCLDRGGFLVDL